MVVSLTKRKDGSSCSIQHCIMAAWHLVDVEEERVTHFSGLCVCVDV